jgi:hypothetical protein
LRGRTTTIMRINCHRTGYNRCSRLCVHVTDNQTRYRALPLRGQNSLRPLKNYDAMSGVLNAGGCHNILHGPHGPRVASLCLAASVGHSASLVCGRETDGRVTCSVDQAAQVGTTNVIKQLRWAPQTFGHGAASLDCRVCRCAINSWHYSTARLRPVPHELDPNSGKIAVWERLAAST